MIQIKNLKKLYNDQKVLDIPELHIPKVNVLDWWAITEPVRPLCFSLY